VMLIVVLLFTFSFSNVQAKQMYFAVLTSYEAIPLNNSTGIGMFSMGPLQQKIDYKVLLSDISNVTEVNLHLGNKDETGPVLVNLVNRTAFPANEDELKEFLVEGTLDLKELAIVNSTCMKLTKAISM
jgi:hypothetical protein